MKLGVFYIATSIYKEYFNKYFLPSMKNLFPKENKELIIISDGLDEYNGQTIDNFNIHVEYIINYPYPSINLAKFQIIEYYAKKYDIDTILYFDADTIIFKKSDEFWNSLKNKLSTCETLMLSYHPHYLYDNIFNFEYELFFPFNELNVGDLDELKIDYYDFHDHHSYMMTSFFMGSYNAVKEYSEKIFNLAKLGLSHMNMRYIPTFSDETYLNIINQKEEYKIQLDNYITINPYTYYSSEFENLNNNNIWENNFPEYENIFINQKFDVELKDTIR